MAKPARNSLKGYTFQQSVFILFLAIMDTERNIFKIEVEALNTKNFDDMYFECAAQGSVKGISYRVQVKNYPKTAIEDITVKDKAVIIKGNRNEFETTDNNILIVNTNQIVTNETFMGLPCTTINSVKIIPVTPEQIMEKLDSMFCTRTREIQIMHLADNITVNAKFSININELPQLVQISTELESETCLIRGAPNCLEHSITFIEGKPGVGKSHYVNELCNKYPNAILYRFWTSSQDPNKNMRIRFETFISEVGIKVYKSAKKVCVEELIATITKENKIIVLDGLDHVENYNPQQLEQFISFINKLENTRTVVLSRPLKYNISWEKKNLLDWTFEETKVYLEMVYGINDYHIQKQIYDVSLGYPIITYYLAEEHKLNGKLRSTKQIASINDYYDKLFINDEKPSEAIGIFAAGNCFFTWKELKGFFSEPEMYDVICDFIKSHPYLFKIIINRVSLIHDSFNTYLKTKITSFCYRQTKTISIVKESLRNGSIEYMARMESFDFDEDFYSEILKKYADFKNFEQLMHSTRDYNSISAFYIHLQKLLEDRMDIYNIYEYYAFALIFQMVNRNDLNSCDSLVYQMVVYMNSHEGIIDNIFSSDFIWQMYLAYCGKEKYALQYQINSDIYKSQYTDLAYSIHENKIFYQKKDEKISYGELKTKLENIHLDKMDKEKALTDYLVSLWIHGKTNNKFFKTFKKYVAGNENSCAELLEEMYVYGLNEFRVNCSLSKAKFMLHELGYFETDNMFRQFSLLEFIMNNVSEGSFETIDLASSYLKLANYEKRELDLSSLAYLWGMYYAHKDYSVLTIDEALIAFEAKSLIKWTESFDIINNLMKQSERGISHLLTFYINKKCPEFASKINAMGYFKRNDYKIRFWELSTEICEVFSSSEIDAQVKVLLRTNYRTKKIEGREILNIVKSKHSDLLLDYIKRYEYSVNSPHDDCIPILDKKNIKYVKSTQAEQTNCEPLQNGYIREEDFDYILENKIDHLEVAQYADGWYSSLPFIDVFSLYKKEDIQKDYKSIIHKAMFARVSNNSYIGNWRNLIGKIPAFLLCYEIDVDWQTIYDIFNNFLKLSLIKNNINNN